MTLGWSLGVCGGTWLELASLITFWLCSLDDNKLKFPISQKNVMFEVIKTPPEEWWHSARVQQDMQFLIGAGVLDHFFMYIFDENMLMFQVS